MAGGVQIIIPLNLLVMIYILYKQLNVQTIKKKHTSTSNFLLNTCISYTIMVGMVRNGKMI